MGTSVVVVREGIADTGHVLEAEDGLEVLK